MHYFIWKRKAEAIHFNYPLTFNPRATSFPLRGADKCLALRRARYFFCDSLGFFVLTVLWESFNCFGRWTVNSQSRPIAPRANTRALAQIILKIQAPEKLIWIFSKIYWPSFSKNGLLLSRLPFFSSQTDSIHLDQDYQQLKLQTLQLWQDQHQKLGNPLPSNADLYQIMRHDHPLGIDAFVSQACQLSPHVNPIQAFQLL